MDHVEKDVAGSFLARLVGDRGQVIRCAARGPGARALGPGVELLERIAGRNRVIPLLQARVDEIARQIGNARIRFVLGEDHRRLVLAEQSYELRRRKRGVPHLNRVAQPEPIELRRQHGQKRGKVGGVELLGRRELPQDRPQPVAQLGDARLEKKAKRLAGLGQHALLHHVARALDRKHEPVRHLLAPLGEGGRRLRPVKGAIDLDGGELRACIGELFGVRQPLGIKAATPGLEGPAADTNPDLACLACLGHRSNPYPVPTGWHAVQNSQLAQEGSLPLKCNMPLPVEVTPVSTTRGRCQCRAIEYAFEGAPKWVMHCHCASCRRAVSSPLATYIGVRLGAVSLPQGRARSLCLLRRGAAVLLSHLRHADRLCGCELAG